MVASVSTKFHGLLGINLAGLPVFVDRNAVSDVESDKVSGNMVWEYHT